MNEFDNTPISPMEHQNAIQFLLEWNEACQNNQVLRVPELLQKMSGGIFKSIIQHGIGVCAQYGSLECLKHLLSLSPEENVDKPLITAAVNGRVACLQFLLPYCPDQSVRDKALRDAIFQEQQETFDILYPLCDGQYVRAEYFKHWDTVSMLDERISQDNLKVVLTQVASGGVEATKHKM